MDQATIPIATNNGFSSGEPEASVWPKFNSDFGWPPFPDFPDNTFPRESLGIIKSDMLAENSLTDLSPRESLDVLNITAIEMGRESIGLYSINNPIFNRQFKDVDQKNIIYSNGSTTEANECLSSNFISSTDPFNEAFLFSSINNPLSISCKRENSQSPFTGSIDNNSNSITSLPLTLGVDNVLKMIAVNTGRYSFVKEIVSGETEDGSKLDNSVVEHDDQNDSSQSTENMFNGEKYSIDLTSAPDWAECDITGSDEEKRGGIAVLNAENVTKQIDRLLLGKRPENLDENMQSNNDDNFNSISSVNISQNISKISRASQCTSDFSNVFETSPVEQNIMKYINIISNLISNKENLSADQKIEGQHHLRALGDLLRDDGNQMVNSGNSLNSSPGNPELMNKSDKLKNSEYELHSAVIRRSASSIGTFKPLNVQSSTTNQLGNTNAKSGVISMGKKFNKVKFGPLKNKPLRATLPVENMSKLNISKKSNTSTTPEPKTETSNFPLNKSSTPSHESKLKPLAASTPGCRQLNAYKKTDMKRNYSRSFSSPNSACTTSEKPVIRRSLSKLEGSELVRRKSDVPLVKEKDFPRLKRSNSIGKESKLATALSRVRKNMLNSPQFNNVICDAGSRGSNIRSPMDLVSKFSDKFANHNTFGKENVKPLTVSQSK